MIKMTQASGDYQIFDLTFKKKREKQRKKEKNKESGMTRCCVKRKDFIGLWQECNNN